MGGGLSKVTDPSALINAIKKREWDEAKTIVRRIGNITEYVDDNEYNALHWACYRDVPTDLMEVLLKSSSQTALLGRNKWGQTPLHWAISSSCNEKNILLVIDACHEAATITDNKGWTPLHGAIHSNNSIEVVRKLLEAHPSAVKSTNDEIMTPLHIFFRMWNMELRNLLNKTKCDKHSIFDSYIKYESEYCNVGSKGSIKVQWLCEVTILLLKAATCDSHRSFRPLHAAIIIPLCPWSFFDILLKLYRHQVSEPDEDGNFPLHLAAATKSSTDGELYECDTCEESLKESSWYQGKMKTYQKNCVDCFYERKSSMSLTSTFREDDFLARAPLDKKSIGINSLISINSKIASFPDSDSRLPLHLVISHSKNKHFDESGIATIFRSSPRALSTRDIATHLYPFMSAAVKDTLHDSSENTKQTVNVKSTGNLFQFTLCFSLLIENPNLVISGIPRMGYKRKRK